MTRKVTTGMTIGERVRREDLRLFARIYFFLR